MDNKENEGCESGPSAPTHMAPIVIVREAIKAAEKTGKPLSAVLGKAINTLLTDGGLKAIGEDITENAKRNRVGAAANPEVLAYTVGLYFQAATVSLGRIMLDDDAFADPPCALSGFMAAHIDDILKQAEVTAEQVSGEAESELMEPALMAAMKLTTTMAHVCYSSAVAALTKNSCAGVEDLGPARLRGQLLERGETYAPMFLMHSAAQRAKGMLEQGKS